GCEHRRGARDVDRANRLARGLDRQCRRRVDEDVGFLHETRRVGRVAHVAAKLLDRPLELGLVQGREIERADVVPAGEQPPCEMEPEKGGSAGDRPAHRGRTLRAVREPGPLVAGKTVAFLAALLAGLTLAAAAHAGNPQIAGLQVALRAYGLYHGPVDAIAGPKTVLATKAFQRRAGLPVDGRAGPATRRALGPLGTPVFGRRTLRRGLFGWDVSVLQFMLARRGQLVPVYGFFDRATERALRRYQRVKRLAADGIAGPVTLSALGHATPGVRPVRLAPAPSPRVRTMLTNWAIAYRLDPALVRALAWMESAFQPGLVSSAGARGVLQVLP